MSFVKNVSVKDIPAVRRTAEEDESTQEFIIRMNTCMFDEVEIANMQAMFDSMKYTNNAYKTFDVKIKKKILNNFINSTSERFRIHQMEIGDLVINGDSDISVYLKLAGIIYVSGGDALKNAKPSGQKLSNALSTAFGMIQKGDKVNSKKVTLSRIISCFPYIACEALKNGYGKIIYPLPYDVYPKCMLAKHFGSIIPKVLLKTSSLDGACCIHALIFVSINTNEDSDSKKMFQKITDTIDSLAIKENRKHKYFDKFGLTTGVYGMKSYSWNYVAWEAFKATRAMLCNTDTSKAKKLLDLAEKWRVE